MQGLKIPVIILVFVGVLGLAIFGDSMVHGQRVVTPLVNALSSTPGVHEARVEGRGAQAQVYVELDERVALATLYPQLSATVQEYLGTDSGKLHLIDTRTKFLDDAYQEMRFAVEEAIATGHFTRMAEQILAMATEYNLDDHAVYIDSHNVYIQLYHDGAHLYAVIARSSESLQSSPY